MKTIRLQDVEGNKPDRVLMAVDLGNGFANYALFAGQWYSINGGPDKIQDVRWVASTHERDQIISILTRRLNSIS